MPERITIRDVLEAIRRRFGVRAQFPRPASRPSVDEWLEAVRERKVATGTRVPPDSILRARDADRR